MSVEIQSRPDRPHSIVRVSCSDAELTEHQQQEQHALADDQFHVPTAHPQLVNCPKDEDFYQFAVLSPPNHAFPAASSLPFWKSSLHTYSCPSPAALAISADSNAAYEVEAEGKIDGEFTWEEMRTESNKNNVLDGHDIIGINVQQLNELTKNVQQIAAWNDLTANLSFAQLQTNTPPPTPTTNLRAQSTTPSYQLSQDEAKSPTQMSEVEQEEDDYEVNEKLRAATPTVLIPAENSVNTSSSTSNPVSPSSSSSFVTPSSTISSPTTGNTFFQPDSSMFDRCIGISSRLHRAMQEFDCCIPLLLEEFLKGQFENVIYQKRNEETIAALEKEVDRLKVENARLLEQQKDKANKSVHVYVVVEEPQKY